MKTITSIDACTALVDEDEGEEFRVSTSTGDDSFHLTNMHNASIVIPYKYLDAIVEAAYKVRDKAAA